MLYIIFVIMITGYGISSYILMILLIIGYFIVKKWGDKPKEKGGESYNKMQS